MKNDKSKDFIYINEGYFADVTASIKNPANKLIIGYIFNDKVSRSKINMGDYSLSFSGTKAIWYTNFVNRFLNRIKCFFTSDGNIFIVYPISGEKNASHFTLPENTDGFIEERQKEWQKNGKKWVLDESSIEREVHGCAYMLGYEGKMEEKDREYKVFEHIVFKENDKVVLQAFFINDDIDARNDVEKVARSIFIKQ